MNKIISVRLSTLQYEILQAYSNKKGLTTTDIIRQLILTLEKEN